MLLNLKDYFKSKSPRVVAKYEGGGSIVEQQ